MDHIAPSSWFISAIFGWQVMILTTWMIFIARIGKTPELGALFLFPICQNLAGYIIPIQGSLAFTSIYFKFVYNTNISQTISVNIALVLSYACLFGITGLILSTANGNFTTAITFALVSITSLAAPILSMLTSGQKSTVYQQPNLFHRLLLISEKIKNKQKRVFFEPEIIAVYILRISTYWLWFIFLADTLGLSFEPLVLLYLIFAVEVSLVLKLTPGNWGTSQASGALALAAIGESGVEGATLITFSMLTILLLNASIGFFALNYFAKKLDFSDLSELRSKLRTQPL
jgi:hypothetical protein